MEGGRVVRVSEGSREWRDENGEEGKNKGEMGSVRKRNEEMLGSRKRERGTRRERERDYE